MNPLAQIVEGRTDELVTADLRGEIDASNVEWIGASLRAMLTNRSNALAVDLTRTSYLDSAGIALLFRLASDLRAAPAAAAADRGRRVGDRAHGRAHRARPDRADLPEPRGGTRQRGCRRPVTRLSRYARIRRTVAGGSTQRSIDAALPHRLDGEPPMTT